MTAAPAIERLGVPAFNWWNEALHGMRHGQATVFPQVIALAATFDEKLIREVAVAISDEARAKFNRAERTGGAEHHGLSLFAPNVNIFRDPRWGRGQETFGEDPLLTSRLAVAYIGGMQGDDPHYLKTLATVKHFAVHSGPESERHQFDARPSPHDLADTYLPQFEAAVREGHVAAVMAAYNRVDGEAAAASPMLLEKILRQKWGFDGYVVGDCGAVDDIYRRHHLEPSLEAAAAAALRAGTDLDCGSAFASLALAREHGLIEGADLDRALTRLFTARFRLGLLDPPDLIPWSNLSPATIESPAHLALAREAAARGIVLLKNSADILPLSPTVKHLAVVGPTAYDSQVLLGTYHGEPSHPVMLVDGIKEAARARGVAISYAHGVALAAAHAAPADLAEAVKVANRSDVTVAVLGLDPRLEDEEGESRLNRKGDRSEIGLPTGQDELLHALVATGKPVVVVLTGGSALAVPWAAEHAAALLYAWYPGTEGGNAVASVLFGDTNPGARLPITIYRSVADLPPFRDYSMRGRTYRYFEGNPLYPFGFGLSYTTFRYSDLQMNDDAIAVQVENMGQRAGDEVIQVYLLPRDQPSYAPHRWLAAFARVGLAPGERRSVRLALSPFALSTVDSKGDRHPLAGEIDVAVGGSQPDPSGRYPDDRHGLTASIHLQAQER
jgi:beta-glucosidase